MPTDGPLPDAPLDAPADAPIDPPSDALPDAAGDGPADMVLPELAGCRVDPPGNSNISGMVDGMAWSAHYAWSAVGCGAGQGHTFVRLSIDRVNIALDLDFASIPVLGDQSVTALVRGPSPGAVPARVHLTRLEWVPASTGPHMDVDGTLTVAEPKASLTGSFTARPCRLRDVGCP